MTRKEIAEKVAGEFGLSKKEAATIVRYVFDAIAESLRKGERVSIQGFGVFDVRERRYRHPRTGEIRVAPGRKKVYFEGKFGV